ncbi:hypothetical protein BDZ91DRAFT_306289 [Kalaharituber pfeilii]|nr:hypothetical protein BDZ91DRAFT_306289 [Kalaharituber pfeilii]
MLLVLHCCIIALPPFTTVPPSKKCQLSSLKCRDPTYIPIPGILPLFPPYFYHLLSLPDYLLLVGCSINDC